MFVPDNSLNSIRKYFSNKLKEKFSSTEIKLMFSMLLESRFDWSQTDVLLNQNQHLSESDLLYFRSAAKQLLDDIPFQHLIGEVEFAGLKLKCDKRALIPRPETEEMVAWMFDNLNPKTSAILDVCAGSGCIGLALKNRFPKVNVTLLEFSKEAIEQVIENLKLNDLECNLLNADALLPDAYAAFENNSLDLVVSNPPYVLFNEQFEMQRCVVDHEPHMALFVPDNDPLLFYRKIGENSYSKLKVGGQLYFEVHESKGEEVEFLLRELGFVNIEVRKDLQLKDRFVLAYK